MKTCCYKNGFTNRVWGRPGSRNVTPGAHLCYFYYMFVIQCTHELSKRLTQGSFDGFPFFSQYFGHAFLLVGEMERKI